MYTRENANKVVRINIHNNYWNEMIGGCGVRIYIRIYCVLAQNFL